MLDKILERWTQIIEMIRDDTEMTEVSYRTWLLPLEPVAFKNDILTLFFPGPGGSQATYFVEKKYKRFITYGIEEITGIKCDICFTNNRNEVIEKSRPADEPYTDANLNPRYTFDNFVVGNSNMLAHSASLAVAEAPGDIYNPLYIYGGVGLGKTHLMQSIAHFVLKQNPNAKILYVSCEKFMNEMIDAIRNSSTNEFREKYRYIDVLLIDDIQFISKKEGTQREFFHTFSALYESKKQIVITSDRPPKDIDDLDERLRSRFSCGLTVDIGLPDYETRIAILRKKEEVEGYSIDDEVIKYIAANIKSNIRELEGALNRIVATSKLTRVPISLSMAEEALHDIITPDAVHTISLPYILEVVSEHFGISTADILSKKRDEDIVYPRHIVMYLAKELTDSSLKIIGQFLGGRDHSTVIHGINNIKEQLLTDDSLRNTMEVLKKKIVI